ncbi:hypothetical protein JKP88DRAFT_194926 [Tribonema minus]|uniref:Uncharacterized protein n=1 Tax=Tribonema minus TaxID=303371 RepID=A0A836CFG4_9STRA|nr:hypothetical protein JKP88DRAFT_194926 [Tribonema minus]
MDDRCSKFCEDASATRAPGKEIGTLRNFLQRNQEQRLTDKAQNHLLEAVRVHVTRAKQDGSEAALSAAFDLVKDALTMPFNIFGSKHKKSLLKWHEDLAGLSAAESDPEAPRPAVKTLQVVDVDADGYLTLMCLETGNTSNSVQVAKKSEQYRTIRKALNEHEVHVDVVEDQVLDVRIQEC